MAEVPNAFLTGWRALPDKLRFHILRYVLPSGATYNASTFRRWEFRSKNWRKLDSLVYLLLSVKEVNSLVIDTIYGQNTLSLEHELYASGIKLPPIHFKRHVWSIEICIRHVGSHLLDLLRNVTDGTIFGQLYSMKIDASNHPYGGLHDSDSAAIDVFEFPARVLEIKYMHSFVNRWIQGHGFGRVYDTFEVVLFDKFTIQGMNKNTTVLLEHYHEDYLTNGKEVVDG
jgi:hypothetical protein